MGKKKELENQYRGSLLTMEIIREALKSKPVFQEMILVKHCESGHDKLNARVEKLLKSL